MASAAARPRNSLATLVAAQWEGALDRDVLAAMLSPEPPALAPA